MNRVISTMLSLFFIVLMGVDMARSDVLLSDSEKLSTMKLMLNPEPGGPNIADIIQLLVEQDKITDTMLNADYRPVLERSVRDNHRLMGAENIDTLTFLSQESLRNAVLLLRRGSKGTLENDPKAYAALMNCYAYLHMLEKELLMFMQQNRQYLKEVGDPQKFVSYRNRLDTTMDDLDKVSMKYSKYTFDAEYADWEKLKRENIKPTQPLIKLHIQVVDEANHPVDHVEVKGAFWDMSGNDRYQPSMVGNSDSNGKVTISGVSYLPVEVRVNKGGYYESATKVQTDGVTRGSYDKDVLITIRKKRNP